MTRPTPSPRVPGRFLERLAVGIFDEPALSTVIMPAIADLQQEVRDAHGSRTRRAGACVRGYVGVWRLVLCAPFVLSAGSSGRPIVNLLLGRTGGSAVALLVPILFLATWPFFGSFAALTGAAGALLATVLRRWHSHHPSVLSSADPLASRPDAEINLSSIPVAGDIGGLFFVLGTYLIVLLGLPGLRGFALAAVVAAVATAGALVAWRARHAMDGATHVTTR